MYRYREQQERRMRNMSIIGIVYSVGVVLSMVVLIVIGV